MDNGVRECLCRLVAEHGRSVCTTPRVLTMMLRQHCPEGGGPIQEFERALTSGGVAPLLAGPVEAADGPEWASLASLLALGVLGGFAGGLLGWIFGGGRSWTYVAHGGTTLGRLAFAAFGAFDGAAVGVLAGLALLGLIGAMVGAMVGA